MKPIIRTAGYLVMFMSILGALFCLISVLVIWIGYIPITRVGMEAIDTAEITLEQAEGALLLANTGVNTIRGPIEAVSGALSIIPGMSSGSSGIGDLMTNLDQLQTTLNSVQNLVVSLHQAMIFLQATFPILLLFVSCIFSLLLLWFAIAQGALFIHGYSFTSGRDLLERWREPEEKKY